MKKSHPSDLRETLSRNLRLARSVRGLSQEELALESGVNRSYLSDVERGVRNVSIDNLDRIATALKVEAWTLLHPGDPPAGETDTDRPPVR